MSWIRYAESLRSSTSWEQRRVVMEYYRSCFGYGLYLIACLPLLCERKWPGLGMTCRIAYLAVDLFDVKSSYSRKAMLIVGQNHQGLETPFQFQCGADPWLSVARLYEAIQIGFGDWGNAEATYFRTDNCPHTPARVLGATCRESWLMASSVAADITFSSSSIIASVNTLGPACLSPVTSKHVWSSSSILVSEYWPRNLLGFLMRSVSLLELRALSLSVSPEPSLEVIIGTKCLKNWGIAGIQPHMIPLLSSPCLWLKQRWVSCLEDRART